jgi:hypothetical protein
MDRADYMRDREKDERASLIGDYRRITGKELPEHMRRIPLPSLERAIEQARSGVVFGEPKPPKEEDTSSLMDWDRQDDKNGNAYS